MAKSVNSCFILGNIGKAPEVRATPSGTVVTTLSIATSDSYKDKDGVWQERAEWHNIVAYGRSAEILRDYAKKGDQIHIEGRLHTSSWDDKESGQKRYKTEIVVKDITLLGGKKHSSDANPVEGGTQVNDFAGQGIEDSDIPF
jgi:single-strand DNA-binding protein